MKKTKPLWRQPRPPSSSPLYVPWRRARLAHGQPAREQAPDGSFDRTTYMREYMRRRRAEITKTKGTK